MNTSTATGKLTVRIESPDPYSYDQPISVIDGSTLELVRTATCNEELSLAPGKYVVSATLPSGERTVEATEVTVDGASELTLAAPELLAETAPPPQVGAPDFAFEMQGEGVTALAWHLRFRSRAPNGSYEADEPHVAVMSRAPGRVELAVSSGAGPLFAQVAAPDEVPLNVALPVYGPTVSQQCRLTLERDPPKPTKVNVSLPDNPRIDAIARYLQRGNLQEAASLGGDAEQLLQQKMADPFGAALGGYALLRLGQLDRLHHWPRNLSDRFPWLPDGAVIAGEESALEDDHPTAITYVCEAGRRGLPVFAAGLSLLASRLREYASAPPAAFGANANLVDEVKSLLEDVMAVMPFADFDRVSLAFHGAKIDSPATSQTPFADLDGADWRSVAEM